MLVKLIKLVLFTFLLTIILFTLKNSKGKDLNLKYRIIENIQFEMKKKFITSILIKFNYKDFEGLSLSWYASYIYEKSKKEKIDPYLIFSFGFTESNWDRTMVGLAGELGPLQFMVSTSKWLLGDKYKYGMEKNILVSTDLWFTYIKHLSEYYSDSKHIILAYNMGPGRFNSLMRYYKNNIEKVKWYVYKRRGYKPYDEKIKFFLDKLKNNTII